MTNNTTPEVESPDLSEEIIQQVEYYFGDMNLPRDKFLQEQIKLDDGWVPLEILTKFHRLAKLSTDIKLIAEALGKSTSGILEISEDNTKIRRNPELPLPELNEDRRKELQERSVYVKGFPIDSTVDTILTFFKNCAKVENVIMRKYQNKETKKWIFKGSVFATFSKKEEAESFLEQKDLKFNDKELIIKPQIQYLKEKQAEYDSRKEKKEKKPKDQSKEEEDNAFKLPQGTTLQFTVDADKLKREEIKEALTKLDIEVAFIDFNIGDKKGWIRMRNENEGPEVYKKLEDGKLKIGENELVFKIPEKEEEAEFLKLSVEIMSRKRKNNSNQKGKKFQKRRKVHQGKNDD